MSNSTQLAGKIAVVTGASRGIGREIAIQFAYRGVRGVAFTYHSNTEAANSVVAEIQNLGCSAIAIKAQTPTSVTFTDSIVQQTLESFSVKQIDILVCNAVTGRLPEIGKVTPEDFYASYDTNVLEPYLLAQSIIPHIRQGGSIINISSISARMQVGGPTTLYSTSKAALEQLTRNLAKIYAADKKITINAVAPGPTDTDGLKDAPPGFVETLVEQTTAEKRLGTPFEVADVVCFLAGGGGARWINGATVSASGGYVMH